MTIKRWPIVAIIAFGGVLIWLFLVTAGQAQGNIENFDDPALPNWAMDPAGSIIWSSTDSGGNPGSGSAQWVSNGRLRRYYLLSPAGHYQVWFKWLWDGTFFTVRVIDAGTDQTVYENDSNTLVCENGGVIWGVGQWNDCQIIFQIQGGGVYWLEFEATSGSVDAIWEPQYSIVGGGGGTGTPPPTSTVTVTATPTGTVTATPTPTATPPAYYLVPMISSDVQAFIVAQGTGADPGATPPRVDGVHNCSWGYSGSVYVECDGITNGNIGNGRYIGGVRKFGMNNPRCSHVRGIYGVVRDSAMPLDFSLNRDRSIGWQQVPAGQSVCSVGIQEAGDTVGCDFSWVDSASTWYKNSNLYAGGQLPDGYNQPYSFHVNDWHMIVSSDSDCAYIPPTPTPSPTPTVTPPFTDTCVFTGTQTVTNTNGTTSTYPISYSVPSNLLLNPSFEDGSGNHPYDWLPTVNGATNYDVPLYWWPQSSHTGAYAVNSASGFDLYNDLGLLEPGDYLLGFYAQCSGGGCPEVTQVKAGAAIIASTAGGLTNTYRVFSGTWSTGGGSTWFVLDFEQAGGTWVDSAFIYPVVDDGFGNLELNCSPEYYPEPPLPPDDTTPGPISPIPIGGAGAVCYLCNSPGVATPNFVSHWIAWLGCVLRNMFSCSLRVWLLVIGNWLKGLVEMGNAWLAWVPATAQAASNWATDSMRSGAAWLGNALLGVGGVYQAGTNIFDLLIALIELIGDLIQILSNLILGIIDLLQSIITAVPTAFSAEPAVFEINGQTAINEAELAQDGPNTSKIMWLFLVPLGVVDSVAVSNFSEILILVMASLSLLIIIWTVNWWSDFVI